MTDGALFDYDHQPEPPKPGTTGYLTWLAELDWPPQHTFWALANTRPPPGHEAVWITGPGGLTIAHVERATGRITI